MSLYSDFLVWGNNQDNLLSKSGSKCLTTPVPLSLPFDIISVTASEKHISFLTRDGLVYSFGSNLDGRLGVSTKSTSKATWVSPVRAEIPGKVIKIQCGFSHVCALTQRMQLYTWGLGDYGALGIGEFKSKSIPTKVDLPINIITSLKQFSCGAMHTSFVTQEGDVYMCGSNQYGELGINKPEKISSPIPISFHVKVQQASCGVFYTLLLTKEGRVYGMGNNKYGQLGIGHKVNQSHPTVIRQLEGIVKVTAGYHSGAIDEFGNMYIWGSGSFGELLKPKKIILSVPIKDISIRGFFGLAIGETSRYENRIYTWGNNTFGELGLGNYQAAEQPIEVEALRGVAARKISLGVNFAILVLHSDRATTNLYRSPIIKQRQETLTDRKLVSTFQQPLMHSHRGYRSRSRQYAHRTTHPPYQETPLPLVHTSIPYSNNKNYQKLFLSLSEDYEILLKKYQQLQKQLQTLGEGGMTIRANVQTERLQNQLAYENRILKQQLSKVRRQLDLVLEDKGKQELKKIIRQKEAPAEPLSQQSKRNPSLLYPPNQSMNSAFIQELEAQYNKILTQKQLLISQLRQNHKQKEDQLYTMLSKLKIQKQELQNSAHHQLTHQSTEKQVHNKKLKAIEEELEKQKNRNAYYEDELFKYKKQLEIQQDNIKKYEVLNNQLESSLMESERRHQNSNEEALKKELLIERVDQLEIELNYQKQFNKKYEATVIELQEMREKIYRELTLEIDSHKQSKVKIEELKGDIETYKKYKQQSDEKSIQIQQMNENFLTQKQKSEQIIGEKDEIINSLEEDFEKHRKCHEQQIQNKDEFIESLNNTTHRLEKQMNKIKETNGSLKQQILMKDEEIDQIGQSKAVLEKKNQYLQTEYNKQYEERQRIETELHDCRRELSKFKIQINRLQNQLTESQQSNAKLNNQLSLAQSKLSEAEEQVDKLSEKNRNLTKENTMYREQIQDLTGKLEKQTAMNEELVRANQQFAGSQEQMTKRIEELQKNVVELQSENQSYTPRYDALLQRNRELDERNKELGEMINKAIEIQAQSYKNNILKEVEINTDQFLNDVNEERTFKSQARRNLSKQFEKMQQEDLEFNSPLESGEAKEEPYTRLMKERIGAHKRKVSESAHKLASLLNLNQGKPQYHSITKTQQYQQLNSQMQNFNNHKEEFISKIHSYAQKLKIL